MSRKYLIFLAIYIFIGFLFKNETIASELMMGYLDRETNRTMVPIRFISEELGANVQWDNEQNLVTIKKTETVILIKIGENRAVVNGKSQLLEAKAVVISGRTYVPVRFVSETLHANVTWLGLESTVVIKEKDKVVKLYVSRGNPVTLSKSNVKVGSKVFSTNIVKVDLRHPAVQLKVALAKDQVGQVEELSTLAKRHGASVAINGTYFDAYTSVTEPYGIIVSDGEPIHVGRDRTVFGFDKNKKVVFDVIDPRISGTTNNSSLHSDRWYAYWLNRTPSQTGNSIQIYTPERGSKVGFSYGTNVIVRNGVVTGIQTGNVSIPKDGFVINIIGNYTTSMLPRFQIGKAVDYKVEMRPSSTDKEFWGRVEGALGVGPRLVTDGKVTVNAVKEGFTQPNILTQVGARSAVGVTEDHYLLLVTTVATMNDLGLVMKEVGAHNAMNLDGGASSGLYVNGAYVTRPGRQISNALLIIEK